MPLANRCTLYTPLRLPFLQFIAAQWGILTHHSQPTPKTLGRRHTTAWLALSMGCEWPSPDVMSVAMFPFQKARRFECYYSHLDLQRDLRNYRNVTAFHRIHLFCMAANHVSCDNFIVFVSVTRQCWQLSRKLTRDLNWKIRHKDIASSIVSCVARILRMWYA